jgi:IPT/TIG domain-containing protein
MPHELQPVRSGDLITAQAWNDLLLKLEEIEQRLDELGGGVPNGPPVITLLQPSDEPAIGSELTILGSGFGTDVENQVRIADLPAQVTGGGGTQLRVTVPVVPGVLSNGLQTLLTVSNPRGFASRSIRVMPAIITVPQGQLFASMTQAPAGTLNAGASHVFTFTVQAVVNIAETYTLSPLLAAQSLPNQWQAVVLDALDSPITAITIPAGQPPSGESRQVRVRVTIPAGATAGSAASLSLTVRSQRNVNLIGTSSIVNLTVGSAPPPAEQLTLNPESLINGSVDPPGLPGGTVVCRPSTTRVTFSVAGTQAGASYVVSLGTVPANWTAAVVGGNTQPASGSQLIFRVDFTPGAGAAAATFNLRVSRQSDANVFGTRALAVRPQ